MNKRIITLVLLGSIIFNVCSQVKYSTAWFGPSANPVPELSGGYIPENTEIKIGLKNFFNEGDYTLSTSAAIELPLISKNVSIKVWSEFFEYYKVSKELLNYRNMVDSTGTSTGDIYVQTRIKLLNEKKIMPGIILNSTLKTASGTNFINRRFFDTPGYYFDLEIYKHINVKSRFIDKIKFIANTGFMCWETSGSRQDDAIMYAIQTTIQKKNISVDLFLGGYDGWMYRHPLYGNDYGDSPCVIGTRINYSLMGKTIYCNLLKGIRDYPYNMFNIGIIIPVKKLNPAYKL